MNHKVYPEYNYNEQKQYYKITVYDDGNQRFHYLQNKWEIVAKSHYYPGKLSIQNIDGKTKIMSISEWKLSRI